MNERVAALTQRAAEERIVVLEDVRGPVFPAGREGEAPGAAGDVFNRAADGRRMPRGETEGRATKLLRGAA